MGCGLELHMNRVGEWGMVLRGICHGEMLSGSSARRDRDRGVE